MLARTGKRRDRWHRYVIAENQGGRTCATTPTVKNNVISTSLQSKVYIVFDMVRRQLKTDGNTARTFAHRIASFSKIGWRLQIYKSCWGNCVLTRREPADLCDFTFDFFCGQMPASACLGTLTSLKMKGLNFFNKIQFPAKLRRGQFVKVA